MGEVVHGYKVFNGDWSCGFRNTPGMWFKQYECPGKFEEDLEPILCIHGMHFCRKLIHCFRYNAYKDNMKVAEVIGYGDLIEFGDKCCTNKLEIVREIPRDEVLSQINFGIHNDGFYNYGSCNKGDGNVGGYNEGDFNTGRHNKGCYNFGLYNIGNFNCGNYNIGSRNSGNWNVANNSNGSFCTEEPKIYLFNKPSSYTYSEWTSSNMFKTLDLIFKNRDDNIGVQELWDKLPQVEKNLIINIENFDAEIFKQCTGIQV